MLRAVALLLVLAVVLAGCTASIFDRRGGEGAEHLSDEEVAWLEDYGVWLLELYEHAAAAEQAPETIAHGPLAGLADCHGSFFEDVGQPPPVFARVGVFIKSACRHYERAARAQARITPKTNPAPILIEIDRALADGDDQLARAEVEIEKHLTESRKLPVVAAATERSHVDPRLSKAASDVVVHRKVEARCWSDRDWKQLSREQAALAADEVPDYAGFVGLDTGRMHLSSFICAPLAELVYEGRRPEGGEALLDLAFSVVALAHEAGHLVGPGASEAVTECYAMQRADELAIALGADQPYARRLAEAFWQDIYPENEPEYRSRECRDGGQLDLDSSSSVWP